MRLVRVLSLVLFAGACGKLAPPRATVTVGADVGRLHDAVLALPTTCESTVDAALCSPRAFYSEDAQKFAPKNSFGDMIEPIVRLKLELAGYMLVDARTLTLDEVGRVDTTTQTERDGVADPEIVESRVGVTRTVAELLPADQDAAAVSLGLAGVLTTALRMTRGPHFQARAELVLSLRALPGGEVLFTARCAELVENPQPTAELIATCAGDGVLAWRAPDAVIGGVP